MINALTQSPIVGKKIFEWREQIENQQMLVRDIIDIDSTYEDFEALSDNDELKTDKKKLKKDKEKINNSEKDDSAKKEEVAGSEDDEFNFLLLKWKKKLSRR